MKTILTTLNSKFIHSALAIRYLKAYSKDIPNIEVMEFTINQNLDYIAGEIYKENPDIIGFSTYIWNRDETLQICEILKIVDPNVQIVLGGPEVSFDGEKLLEEFWFIDYIVYGEGERTFNELLNAIIYGKYNYKDVDGLIYRENEEIIKNKPRQLIESLEEIPSPYRNIKDNFKNKIVYFESARGCPFNCQFCLSSTIKGVRYFDIDRVKDDLDKLIDAEVRQIKFVDRTFNANKEYAMEIMNFIMEKDPENINFHFEVTGHLVDDEMLEFIKDVKSGLFQFEIGVQSTNDKTIEAIGRTTDFKRLKEVSEEIKSFGKIHQHLDLIAGLPYEGYEGFKKSFNDVYEIKPEKLQLGFLKLLKGSGLRTEIEKYGFKFLDQPPYEVLETDNISYDDMLILKGIEDLVEKYYNAGSFEHSLNYIVKNYYHTAFDFFEDFLKYWENNKYNTILHSRKKLYKILFDFYKVRDFGNLNILEEVMKYDYIYNNKNPNVPNFLNRINVKAIQKNRHDILKDEKLLKTYLIHYKDKPTKYFINKVHIECFTVDIIELIKENYNLSKDMLDKNYILFDYKDDPLDVCNTNNINKYVSRSE